MNIDFIQIPTIVIQSDAITDGDKLIYGIIYFILFMLFLGYFSLINQNVTMLRMRRFPAINDRVSGEL